MQVIKFNLITDLQIMLSNVTHSDFYSECNTERGFIEQLYIELGIQPIHQQKACDLSFLETESLRAWHHQKGVAMS